MGTLVRDIVDDVQVDLNQILDDNKIQKAQIAYWVIIVANRLKAQHIQKRDSGAFLTTFAEIPVLSSDDIGDNLVRYRKYFDLPQCIYDFNNDDAISYITYSVSSDMKHDLPPITQVTFTRTTPGALETLYLHPYTKPKSTDPYFYRSGGRIYLMGIECIEVESVEVGLYLTLDPVSKIDMNQVIDFPEELILILKKNVLDMGRFSLLIPKERVNDGSGNVDPGRVPTNKIVSVNDPVNISE